MLRLRYSGDRDAYQPPPPPPPPPPPENPPPPEPLLEPGAVEAELIVLASDEPMLSAKPVGLSHGLLDPAYQMKPWCPPGAAAAAARTLRKRSAQRFSTPKAIAYGRYFSNSWGVSSGGVMRSSRSRSVIERYCLKPAMRSRTARPSRVGAAIHQKQEMTSGKARIGSSRGRNQPLLSASPTTGTPIASATHSAPKTAKATSHLTMPVEPWTT